MQIPSYQIQNVLKNYSRQLSQGKILARNKAAGRSQPSGDNVSISAEAKRTTILEKVTASIVDRITTMGPKEEVELQIADQVEKVSLQLIEEGIVTGDLRSLVNLDTVTVVDTEGFLQAIAERL